MGVANCAERDRHEPVCIHHSTLTTQHSNGTNTLEEYVYDYMGRRIAKETTTHATEDEEYRVFFYHGWNVAAEYTTDSSWANEDLDFTYTWGLDLSGSLQGAGGVGGLLVAEKVSTGDSGEYYPTYDGNGNVSEYLDSSGSQVAHYEYDQFGVELSLSSGNLKNLFTFKFSTKYEDEETLFYYYGYRYYDPATGRWLSRDPIEEGGGINLYAFVGNDGIGGWDFLGLIEPGLAFPDRRTEQEKRNDRIEWEYRNGTPPRDGHDPWAIRQDYTASSPLQALVVLGIDSQRSPWMEQGNDHALNQFTWGATKSVIAWFVTRGMTNFVKGAGSTCAATIEGAAGASAGVSELITYEYQVKVQTIDTAVWTGTVWYDWLGRVNWYKFNGWKNRQKSIARIQLRYRVRCNEEILCGPSDWETQLGQDPIMLMRRNWNNGGDSWKRMIYNR